jgi:mRNA interferase RelE/StbE
MPYEVLVEREAEKDISRLPSDVLGRIEAQIWGLAHQPRPPGCRKLGGGLYRVRVGDYRIVYSVYDGSQEVRVELVSHRSRVYRLIKRRLG